MYYALGSVSGRTGLDLSWQEWKFPRDLSDRISA